MDADQYYDGIPVPELPVTEIDVPDAGHLQRSSRYPGALDIQPDAAIEAALDARALIARDPNSARSVGQYFKLAGWACAGGVERSAIIGLWTKLTVVPGFSM